MKEERIAVIGAGPIGLEAALALRLAGCDVEVFERDEVGANLARWGHVRLFSSFALNHSARAARVLEGEAVSLPDDDAYLLGIELLERFLRPLARSEPLRARVHEHTAVVSIGRDGIGKNELIGDGREGHAFRLLVEDGSGAERFVDADIVVDCTGTYGAANANWMGNGGVPARGERRLRERSRVHYELVDVAGASRARFEGKKVLVVGSGHSAATALRDLVSLDGTTAEWVARKRELPEPIPGDPLPEREALSRLAADLARGTHPRVRFHPETRVEALDEVSGGFEVTLRGGEGDEPETLVVSEMLAHVGYRPDNEIYRELQVHECYASNAPMKLAAALLGEGSGGDCLTQSSKGKETLKNPEPGFFILGAKSYGRNSNFLIRVGLEQIEDLLELVAPDASNAREEKIS